MFILLYMFFFHQKWPFFRFLKGRELIKDVVLFGASVLCLIASLTTFITYLERHTLSAFPAFPLIPRYLPGVRVINESILCTLPYIIFYSFFLVHFLSFVLRISLNYYHISINEFNSVPHIVSFFGPLVCQYQYWVVGLYMVLSFFVLPLNRDGFWMSVVLGSGLLAFLMMYGTDSLLQNLTNGIVIALMLLTVLPFLWKK